MQVAGVPKRIGSLIISTELKKNLNSVQVLTSNPGCLHYRGVLYPLHYAPWATSSTGATDGCDAHLDRVLIGFEDEVKLESLVLRSIDGLLELGLARRDELRVLRPTGKADPSVVEDLSAENRPAAAARLREVLGQGAVARAQALAGGVV